MITERGTVVAIEQGCLWLETIRLSTCNSCSAQKACGHGLMNKMVAGRQHYVRALLDEHCVDTFQLGDEVEISISEQVLVSGAFIVYLLPLLSMLAGALISAEFFVGDAAAVAGAVLGFVAGLSLVKYHAHVTRDSKQFQPRVVANRSQNPHKDDTAALIVN